MPRERVALFEFLPQPGGGQRVCALIAQTLSSQYEVELLSPKPLDRAWWEESFDVDLSEVHVSEAPVKGWGRRRVNKLPVACDIFVNAEYAYWAIDPARARKRLIMAHDAHPVGRRPSYLEHYHRAVACSLYGRSKLEDERWPIPKTVLYPPIFEANALSTQGMPKENRILTVARFDTHRLNNSLPTVLRAFRNACDLGLRDYELVCAGWVHDTDLLSRLTEFAQGYPVRFVPSPTRPHLRLLYRSSRFLLNVRGIDAALPSTSFSHEALGVVTVEAISHGCLPIVHGFAGHLETVPDPALHVADVDSLPSRLIEIVRQFEDPQAWKDAWCRLYETSRERFAPDAYLMNFRRLVDEIE